MTPKRKEILFLVLAGAGARSARRNGLPRGAAHARPEAPPDRLSFRRQAADAGGDDRFRAGRVLRKRSFREGLVERDRGCEQVDGEAGLFGLLQLAGLELDDACNAVAGSDE